MCVKQSVSLTEKVLVRVDYLVFATWTALLRAKRWVRVTLKVPVNGVHLVRVTEMASVWEVHLVLETQSDKRLVDQWVSSKGPC